MINTPMFYYIINVAKENGYKIPEYIIKMCDICNCELIEYTDLIIYSHSFAKAFFGEQDSIYSKNAWVNRLQEMSKEEDGIKYLEKFI